MKEKEIQDDLASIRSLMERSSKFISLSGLSGILAGVYALIGAAAAFYVMQKPATNNTSFFYLLNVITALVEIAAAVLIASVATCFLLSYQKAKKKNQPIWGKTSRLLLFQTAIPLLTGGLFMIILLSRGYYGFIAPASLVFYGLALTAASSFTYTDVKYLGLCEIILGLVCALYPDYGLYFWAIGFGILHIVYGSVMYLKYDR
jgi:hypothetical protein